MKHYLVLLILLTASGFGQSAKKGGTFVHHSSPKIVGGVALTGQTADIPATTIFNPKGDGLYRISVYGTVTVPSTTFGCQALLLSWADDAGRQAVNVSTALTNPTSGCGLFLETDVLTVVQETFVIRANTGTPIQYEVTGTAEGTTYELFMIVERLM